MKAFLALFFFTTSLGALAMPYRCTSLELKEGAPVVSFKINPQRNVYDGDTSYLRWVIGVTPTGRSRFVLYAQGTVDPGSIGLTFVQDQTVTGWMQAHDRGDADTLEGEFKHSDVSRETLHIKCVNVASTEPVAPTVE